MTTARRHTLHLIFLFGFLPAFIIASAQKKLGLEPDKWAIELSKGGLTEVNSMGSLSKQLMAADTLRALRFLDSVEQSNNAKGYFFRAHFDMVKASYLYAKFGGYDKYKDRGSKELKYIKDQMMKLYADAIDAAYHTEDERTIGWVSFYSATLMLTFGETARAVMYSKNGVDLLEKAKYPVEPPVYTDLAELLYTVREYDESIVYAKKGISAWKINDYEKEYKDPYKYKIRALNTIGTTFYKKNQHDSANVYYQQALQLAKYNRDTIWMGKVLGNIGRIMYVENKFDSAYLLFKTDYQNSKADSIYDNAANESQWAARANLARGNKVAALAEAREAIRLLAQWPSGPYLRDTYYTLAAVFRAMGNYDSAFYYNDRYTALNDSLEKEVATSSLAISKAKLNDEVSRFNIQKLNKEKRTQIVLRNIIIAGTILVSLLILLMLNRNRLKTRMKMEMIEKEKALMEQEIESAQTQLKMFTENIIEKTNLIEKLEQQVKGRDISAGQHAIINELSLQTILTEEDWNKFRSLFEKIYPGFFIKLKEKSPDITLAEQRMAALTRLYLTTKQIASMLGISIDSVHKTRQRLRQRLRLGADASLEESIGNL
jgi:DNA-binding CsgD family transcriptional regulator/tetratricopeptide (TPR) repeat protein